MASDPEYVFNNLANGRIKADLSSSGLSLELYEIHVEPFRRAWSSGDEMYLTLVDGAANREVVKVTGISGNVLTVERGQDNTSARAWYAGTLINQRVPNVNLERIMQKESYRTITEFPHGSLVPDYPGEEILYDDRWWKSVPGGDGTNWRLIVGSLAGGEEYDEDGYVVLGIPYTVSSTWGINAILEFSGALYVALNQSTLVKTADLSTWEPAGDLNTVLNFGIHSSTLYCTRSNEVWAFQGGTSWNEVFLSGGLPATRGPYGLASFGGKLYATCTYGGDGDLYRGFAVELAYSSFGRTPRPIVVHDSKLYVGCEAATLACYEWTGIGTVTYCGDIGGSSYKCYRLISHDGSMYAATRTNVHRYDGGTTWTSVGDASGDGSYCLDIISFNGDLYGIGAQKVTKYTEGSWVDQNISKEANETFNVLGAFGSNLLVGTKCNPSLGDSHIYYVV